MGIILLLLLGLSSFGFHSGFITASTEQISLYTGVTSTLTICTTLLFPSPPPYLNPRPFEATPVFSVFSSLRHGDVWIATRAREPSQPELPRSDKILQIVIYTRLYYSRSRTPFRAHAVIPQHSQSEITPFTLFWTPLPRTCAFPDTFGTSRTLECEPSVFRF